MYDLARQLARCLSVGPKTIVAKSFGGKGSKLHVDTEETISFMEAKASKKLEGTHWTMDLEVEIKCQHPIGRSIEETRATRESLYRLKHLGITRLMNPTGIASAMSQLPNEAIALAAASHGERERQITPWTLSTDFVACTNQKKATVKSTAVIGTDADLRRLSMEAAGEVASNHNDTRTSSEQAASGVKVDPTTINKYARGQRMSFVQLQQQTRERCQEIWDRQVQSLTAIEEGANDSESNSELDSFAGDLENLLDAEECEDEKMELTKKKKAGPARKEGGLVGPHLGFGSENVEHNKRPSSKLPVQLSLTRLTILWRTFRGQNGCK
ncbi:hypothetical protein CRG98_043066 [Punica granatum]|uniref:Uncharacterized protein n=1 Tax=Punica granatum TaxID=22663 RepID=A0A2I0HXW8_PUNGR|nr:hypothetical protein CRG98_043066 [Punica granatum]